MPTSIPHTYSLSQAPTVCLPQIWPRFAIIFLPGLLVLASSSPLDSKLYHWHREVTRLMKGSPAGLEHGDSDHSPVLNLSV